MRKCNGDDVCMMLMMMTLGQFKANKSREKKMTMEEKKAAGFFFFLPSDPVLGVYACLKISVLWKILIEAVSSSKTFHLRKSNARFDAHRIYRCLLLLFGATTTDSFIGRFLLLAYAILVYHIFAA